MIEIDCSEMTLDEQLALSASISDGLAGKGIALLNGNRVMIDPLGGEVSALEILALVQGFVSRRKDARYYSVETKGEKLAVHTPDPLSRSRGSRVAGLPGNLLKCPHCSFVTPYQELYNVHLRSHYF